MKPLFLSGLFILFTLTVSAQFFKNDDLVDVDPLLSDSMNGPWKRANVLQYDTSAKTYTVKLVDGKTKIIPSRSPEKWIRPVAKPMAMLGPSKQIRYENRDIVIKAFSCRPSEIYIKKNVKAHLAGYFKDYSSIFVDFTSFKAQNGYDDPKVKQMHVYPYKIEMVVYLKRTLFFGGKPYTEYQTWEFDRVYEYFTRPGNKCEFKPVPASDAKKLSGGWYE